MTTQLLPMLVGSPATSQAISESVRDFINALDNGEFTDNQILTMAVNLKALEDLVVPMRKAISTNAAKSIRAFGSEMKGSKLTYNGAEIIVKRGKVTYDYDNAEWQSFKDEEEAYTKQAKDAASKRKAVEEILQRNGMAIAVCTDPDSVQVKIL